MMADSTPLLSSLGLADVDNPGSDKHLPSLNSTIEKFIGELNWFQFLQAVLVSCAWLFDAQQTFISVFTDSHPSWHCNQEKDSASTSCSSSGGVSNICQLPVTSWSWDLPVSSSIISEWSLECASSFITGLPASSFFFGCLVGGLVLATLADSSLGRKNMLSLSCLMMSLSSFLTIFATNIWIYSALRLICGFGRATIGTSALVLATELVGKRWRGQIAVIGFFCFTLGFLTLPAIAYANRGSTWRNIYLWTSVPTLVYSIIVHFCVRESPRWLYVKGRKEEAVATLKSMSSLDHRVISKLMSTYELQRDAEEDSSIDLYSAIKILLQKPWAWERLLKTMAIGFGIGFVYYGMPLALGNLSFNLYLSVTLNALSELPAALIIVFLIHKMNRRSSVLAFSVLSGVCSVMSIMKGPIFRHYQIVFEMVSFFSACTAFNILLIYAVELFPTCVRNSAISFVRQAIVLGGVFSPILVSAGSRHGNFLSYGVFGLVIGCCGVFAVFLPETRGRTLCDTMEEAEQKENTASYV